MALPDYLILGAQRCGTSSLIRYLADHPQVVPPANWEVHFFDFANWSRGVDWYKRQLGKRGPDTFHGEKSPGYLVMPYVPNRVKNVCPQAKFIVMLRDPVERAYSQYKLRCNLMRENQSFDNAIHRALSRQNNHANWLGYIKRGYYAEQLEHWFTFFPREQFLVVQSERFYRDARRVYTEVLDFIGLPLHHIGTFKRHGHVTQHNKCPDSSLHGMSDETCRLLTKHYQSYNTKLYDLLKVDYKWSQLD